MTTAAAGKRGLAGAHRRGEAPVADARSDDRRDRVLDHDLRGGATVGGPLGQLHRPAGLPSLSRVQLCRQPVRRPLEGPRRAILRARELNITRSPRLSQEEEQGAHQLGLESPAD